METFQLSQPRLKCGEVFIWDCVGELFAIECQLCEERPLCTLSEFTEHMDVWHYDWTAEAYASLPDMPDTTTMSDDETSLWATASDVMYASSATPTERTESLSSDDDGIEFESEYFEDDAVAAKTVEEVDMKIEAALENGSAPAQTKTIVYEGNQSTNTTPSPTFDTAASSTAPFEDNLMLGLDVAVDATNEFSAASDANEASFCVSAAAAAAQQVDEEIQTNSLQATTTSLIMQKQVEPPTFQCLKTQKLIEIYEKFPELWHKQRNPQDTAAQTKAYKSISCELSQQGIKLRACTVQRRIHALRKRYRLEKLKELKHVLEGCPYESRFEFYDQLQFLKHHIAPQLCKICNRICKDAAECCTRPPVTAAIEEQDIYDSEVTASADEVQYTESVQPSEYQASAELEKTDVQMQVETEEAPVYAMAMPVEALTTRELVRAMHCPDCDGNELQHAQTMPAMETITANETVCGDNVLETLKSLGPVPAVDMAALAVQQELACFENVQMTVQASLAQLEAAENSAQENSYIQLTTAAYVPQEEPFLEHMVPDIGSQDSFIQQNNTGIEPQETFLVQNNELLLQQHCVPETELPGGTYVQHTVPAFDAQETWTPLESKNKVEILEVLELPKVHYLDSQEQGVPTSTVEAIPSESITDENMAVEEYESSNGDSGVLRDLDEQCDEKPKSTKGGKRKRHPTFARLSTEQARKLISIYEKYPTLWDPKHADYSTRDRRRKAWNKVTAQINEAYQTRYTWTTVHRKMHDYMKYYRRERQRIEAEGGQTRWFFYDDFSFLNPVIDEENSDLPKVLQSKMQNRKIIDLYKSYPQLWDTNHAEFKRRAIRQGLFREMSEKLQNTENITISGLKLQQRIVEFRCTYRMEKERRCSAEKRGESYKPSYDYYEQLQFLDAHTSPFICDKCDAQFAKHGERERHIQKEHIPKKKLDTPPALPPATTFEKKVASLDNVCHICGNGFTLRRTLLCHLKRHNSQPTRACSVCPKRFFDTHTLQIHERSHTKSRPFICEQCGASYASGSKLNQHLKRHSNQRDHPCKVCGKAFYSAFECERHLRTHANAREKVCPVCGKDFAVGSSYYAHMLLHETVKRYKCADCNMKFAQFAGLYKHRKRHHPAKFALERAEKARKAGEIAEEIAEEIEAAHSGERLVNGAEL